MKLFVKKQESYSRGELLLRTFFGFIYITLPHYFILGFVGIWSSILAFIAWWIILFTGKYPQSMFEFQTKLMAWQLRVATRMYNLSDGYPAFGINGTDEYTSLEIPYPEKLSRGLLLVKTFFGFIYVMIPHGFVLMFRMMWNGLLIFIAWWAVLFTANYPSYIHRFTVGSLRWSYRVNMYMGLWMTDEYPPFSGKEIEQEVVTEPVVSSETE